MTHILTDRGVDGPYLFSAILRVFTDAHDREKAAEYLLDVFTDIEVDVAAFAKAVLDLDAMPFEDRPKVFLKTLHTFIVENNLHV